MNPDLTQQAISAALTGNWKDAVKINLTILKRNPRDVDTLNRLAHAYLETGFKTKSGEISKKVLKIDKFNTIATKSLDALKDVKIDRSKKSGIQSTLGSSISMFLEEPGITKTVTLINLGEEKTIKSIRPGNPVNIAARGHNVAVVSISNQYLGRLPDDLASRLRPLINEGNTYSCWIRSTTNGVKVFIRETYRCPKFRHIPSFPLTEKLAYAAFTPPELVHEEKPDVLATEYQEEDGGESEKINREEATPEAME